jgi:hypothetical protein
MFFSGNVYAQKNTIIAGLHTHISQNGTDFQPMELGLDAGYNITDDFFVNLRYEHAVALFTIDNTDSHYAYGTYGSYLGYKIIKFDGGVVDLRAGLGDCTSKKEDWKYSYYDFGINFNAGRERTKPTLGLGVRFYNSKNDIYKDYTRVYMSLGFTFN